MTPARKALNDYTDAAREIELAGVAIGILETMRSKAAARCIKVLLKNQHSMLTKLDRAAAKLGAPYPS